MSGTIPASIANILNISTLRLNTNEFSGTLPPELGQCTLMRIFKMYSNRFVGTLPASYGNFSKVETFGVDDNYLFGTIPPSYGNMTVLFAVYLYNNSFTCVFHSCVDLSRYHFTHADSQWRVSGIFWQCNSNVSLYD
jgi:hypothetical protein